MIKRVLHLLKVLVIIYQPFERFGCEGEVFQIVLLNHARIVKTVFDNGIGSLDGFGSEGDLFYIIFSAVRVVLGREFCLRGVCRFLRDAQLLETVAHGLQTVVGGIVEAFGIVHSKNRAVGTPPVVLVLALAPFLLEILLALHYRHGIVKIPKVGLLLWVLHLRRTVVLPRACGAVVGIDFRGAGFGGRVGLGAALLFLLLLQGLNHAVDGRIARRLVHTGQGLQTVLQVHSGGVRHEFVEHLGAAHRFLVALALLVEQADGLSVATLRLVKPPLVPIYFAEAQHQHTFLYAAARAFGTPFLVCGDGLHRVGELHIDIA